MASGGNQHCASIVAVHFRSLFILLGYKGRSVLAWGYYLKAISESSGHATFESQIRNSSESLQFTPWRNWEP